MANVTQYIPIMFGGAFGWLWQSFITGNNKGKDGFVYGAAWGMSYGVIQHRIGQPHLYLQNPSPMVRRCTVIVAYIFTVIAGYALRYSLNRVMGLAIDRRVVDGIALALLVDVFVRFVRIKG